MRSVFLSYSRENQEVASSLARDLEYLDFKVWYDKELSGGQAWWLQVLANIRSSDTILILLSAASLQSIPCRSEWTYVL